MPKIPEEKGGTAVTDAPKPAKGKETAAKPPVKKEAKVTKPAKEENREIVYPEVKAKLFTGEKALTISQLKSILGWEEEPEGEKWGSDYLFLDRLNKKVRCSNNTHNRPFYTGLAEAYMQEHLNKRWAGENNFPGETINGETLIIGRTGLVNNGQHQSVGAVWAEQELLHGPNAEHWQKLWGEGKHITMEKLVVYGISESDLVINTMDTCKPRSLADVIFRSKLFAKETAPNRKIVARSLDYAVRLLWNRTGVRNDAYAAVRTHTEAIDFVERHMKLVKAVKHIFTEDVKRSISELVSPGAAAGMLYLMGSSNSEAAGYLENRTEKKLTWDNWDAACDFWTKFSGGDADLKPLRIALGILSSDEPGEGTGSLAEKTALVVKAWGLYQAKEKMTEARLRLKYVTDEFQKSVLDEPDVFGGIDLGESKYQQKSDDPSQEEIAAASKAKAETTAPKSEKAPSEKKTLKPDTKKKTAKKK